MEYRQLGRTGLRVSLMALGCGGPSRLGLSTGRTTAQSAAVVQAALDAGINLIDTATAYQTEALVAAGLRGRPRDQVVLSSKRGLNAGGERLLSGAELEAAVEASLRRLETDYIDIYHLHGVSPEQYPHARDEMVPALQRLRAAGKVRLLGITERFGGDTEHRMLRSALADGHFDVIMVGFNMLNQTARDHGAAGGRRARRGDHDHVRGTARLQPPAAPARAARRAGRRAARWTRRWPRRTSRWVSCPPRPPTSPMPPIATAAISRESAPCSRAPAISTTCTDNVASFARGPLSAAATARIDRLFAAVTSVERKLTAPENKRPRFVASLCSRISLRKMVYACPPTKSR